MWVGDKPDTFAGVVDKLIQTTRDVRREHRFEYWRDTVLPAVEAMRVGDTPDEGFSASRWLVNSAHGTLVSTMSAPVAIRRHRHHAARDGVDLVAVQLLTGGIGYQEQDGRRSVVRPGDIAVTDLSRPFSQSVGEPYEELRLYLPREVFQGRIGGIETLAGRVFAAGDPLVDLTANYLRMAVEASPRMSDPQMRVMCESLGILLRGLGQAEGAPLSAREVPYEPLRAVAESYIRRRLHDPGLGVPEIVAALGTSRSRLYAAFAEQGGVLAAIRDARLEAAYARLSRPGAARGTILSIALGCGFPDHSTFGHAFRRRFGVTPSDVAAGACRQDAPADGTVRAAP